MQQETISVTSETAFYSVCTSPNPWTPSSLLTPSSEMQQPRCFYAFRTIMLTTGVIWYFNFLMPAGDFRDQNTNWCSKPPPFCSDFRSLSALQHTQIFLPFISLSYTWRSIRSPPHHSPNHPPRTYLMEPVALLVCTHQTLGLVWTYMNFYGLYSQKGMWHFEREQNCVVRRGGISIASNKKLLFLGAGYYYY